MLSKNKLNLSTRVTDVDFARFDKFDWSDAFKTELKEYIYPELGEKTRNAIDNIERANEQAQSAKDHVEPALEWMDDVRQKIRDTAGEFTPEWFDDLQDNAEKLRDIYDQTLESIDEFTAEAVIPDDVVNNCL